MTTHEFFEKHKDTIYKVELKEDHLYFIKTKVDPSTLHEVDLYMTEIFEKTFNIDNIWIKDPKDVNSTLTPYLFEYPYLISKDNTIYVQLEDHCFDGSANTKVVGFSYKDTREILPVTFIKTADGTSPEHIRL